MISAKENFDADMVRSAMAERGLDPTPSADPMALTEKDGSRLTVEQYAWGCVFFAQYKSRGIGITWIEIDGVRFPELPAWAGRLRDKLNTPECFGWWRPIKDCDGTGRKFPPCRFRGSCIALQRRALQRVHVDRVELDPVTYPPKLSLVRVGLSLAVLEAEAAPDPEPQSRSLRTPAQVAAAAREEHQSFRAGQRFVDLVCKAAGWKRLPRILWGRSYKNKKRYNSARGRKITIVWQRYPAKRKNKISYKPGTVIVREIVFAPKHVPPRRWISLALRHHLSPKECFDIGICRIYVGMHTIRVVVWTNHAAALAARTKAFPDLIYVARDRSIEGRRSGTAVSILTGDRAYFEAAAAALAEAVAFVAISGLISGNAPPTEHTIRGYDI